MAPNVVERTKLTPGSPEYQEVCEVFHRKSTTSTHQLAITSVERVRNYDLEQKFKEKQDEYKRLYGHVQVVKVFHGTRSNNVASILKNNLDLRRHGQNVGHRFGAGVSFSAMASYASHYCDKGVCGSMVLCEVLVANMAQVEENKGGAVLREPPLIPGRYPLRFDTTAKNKETMDVIVKFEENSFCPAYVVTFKRGALPDDEDDDDDLACFEEEEEDDDDASCGCDDDDDYDLGDDFNDFDDDE